MRKIKIKCKCGCGRITKAGNKYIHNHHRIGKISSNFKHGLTNHKLHIIWTSMKQRCYYKPAINYKDYGGRGIRVCIRWRRSFISFYNWAITHGWKEGLEIDRIDNDGNYTPSNCRFVTRRINVINRRKQKNNTSGYTGISLHKKINKYESYVTINKNRKYIGCYNTLREAINARDRYITENKLKYKLSYN